MQMKTIAIAAALSLAAVSPAAAATITSLYSTGVTNAGVATTGNGADLHWLVDGNAVYTGGTNGSFPIGPWVNDSATSRWITPTTNAADGTPTATYSFSTTFDLTGYSPFSASFSGKFAADDEVTSVILNGTNISITGGGYSFFTPFSYSGAGFVAGVNTLTFNVLNSGGGPTGFNAEISGTAFVPEPATWTMMISGFGLVGVAARRRRRTVAA